MPGPRKLRRTFTIEPDLLARMRAIKARTGLSESEQVRQGIRWWLESREWPVRAADRHETADAGGDEMKAGPAKPLRAGRRKR